MGNKGIVCEIMQKWEGNEESGARCKKNNVNEDGWLKGRKE